MAGSEIFRKNLISTKVIRGEGLPMESDEALRLKRAADVDSDILLYRGNGNGANGNGGKDVFSLKRVRAELKKNNGNGNGKKDQLDDIKAREEKVGFDKEQETRREIILGSLFYENVIRGGLSDVAGNG